MFVWLGLKIDFWSVSEKNFVFKGQTLSTSPAKHQNNIKEIAFDERRDDSTKTETIEILGALKCFLRNFSFILETIRDNDEVGVGDDVSLATPHKCSQRGSGSSSGSGGSQSGSWKSRV